MSNTGYFIRSKSPFHFPPSFQVMSVLFQRQWSTNWSARHFPDQTTVIITPKEQPPMDPDDGKSEAPAAALAEGFPEEYDEEPAFIDANADVEVEVEDGDEPMSDDDEDEDGKAGGGEGGNQPLATVEDHSLINIKSHAGPVYAVSTHFDAATKALHIVSGGGDDRAYLHTMTTGSAPTAPPQVRTTPLTHAHTDSVSSVAFNSRHVPPDATGKAGQKLVAVGSYDGSLVLYDASNGEVVKVLDGPTDVEFVDFHPKGGTVALAGSIADGTVWMYHTPSAKCLQVFVGHEGGDGQGGGGVSSGTFTPDGKFALSAGMDGTIRLWAPRTGLCKHVFRCATEGGGGGDPDAGLTCLQVDGGADGQLAVAGSEDGMAYVVHLSGKKVVARLRHFEEAPGQPRQQQSAAGGDGMDVDGGGPVEFRSVEAVGFAPRAVNAQWVATGGVDGNLKVWDITQGGQGQCRQICRPVEASAAGVTRLLWHPVLPLILASHTDGAIRLWDARNGALVSCLTGGHAGVVINDMSAEFIDAESPSGGTVVVATAADDGGVRIYEINVANAIETVR